MLENVFKVLGTKNVRDQMAKFGVKVFDHGQIRPFLNIIEDIKKSVSGLTDEQRSNVIEKMGFTEEARSAILTMIQDTKALKTNIDFVKDSQGQLNIAYEAAKTRIDDWKLVSNELKRDIWEPFGDMMLSLFTTLGTKVLDTIKHFKELGKEIKSLTDSFNDSNLGRGFEHFYLTIKPYLIWINDIVFQISRIFSRFMHMDAKGYLNALYDFTVPDLAKIKKDQYNELHPNPASPKYMMADQTNKPNKPTPSIIGGYLNKEDFNFAENPMAPDHTVDNKTKTDPNAKPPGSIIDNITGSAKQVKNIEIKIGSFIDKLQISNQNMQNMDEKQLEQFMSDMFMRVIRNVETSYQ
jgi:hypothetical protein